jgi:hypothetical protein
MNRLGFKYDDPDVELNKKFIWELVDKMISDSIFVDEDVFAVRFLLLGGFFGTDADIIGRLAGCPRDLGRKFARICREQRIWIEGKTNCQWFDERHGLEALICDTLVLRDKLVRAYE